MLLLAAFLLGLKAPQLQPVNDEVTYEGDIKHIIENTCIVRGCHDGTVLPELDTYKKVKAERRMIARRIQSRVAPMPPRHATKNLSDDERQLIIDWIVADCPEE